MFYGGAFQCKIPSATWRRISKPVGATETSFPRDLELTRSPSTVKPAQTWDPTIGAFREQRVPLALSKSSFSANSSHGRPSTPSSQRSAVSSLASAPSSIKFVPSSFASFSLARASGSYVSHGSFDSHSTDRSSILPQYIFQILPPEIYATILHQLGALHRIQAVGSCQTCYLRDLCALSLTSRAWDKAVVKKM